jgi:hypothetical protein
VPGWSHIRRTIPGPVMRVTQWESLARYCSDTRFICHRAVHTQPDSLPVGSASGRPWIRHWSTLSGRQSRPEHHWAATGSVSKSGKPCGVVSDSHAEAGLKKLERGTDHFTIPIWRTASSVTRVRNVDCPLVFLLCSIHKPEVSTRPEQVHSNTPGKGHQYIHMLLLNPPATGVA